MRQFTPRPELLQAIRVFNTTPFRVTALRDKYAEMFSSDKDKSELRRWIHSFMRTLVKHGYLEEVEGNHYKAFHFRATSKTLQSSDQNTAPTLVTSHNDALFHTMIQKRLTSRQQDILISLGATEELENLKEEFPSMATQIDTQLSELKEQNVRNLGKIKALESLLQPAQ